MTALRVSSLPEPIRNEMARLKAAGHHLLPLGGGAGGKAPLLRAWAGPGLTLGQILAPMHRTGSQAYRVRLDGLAVIDCDSDDAELVAKMEARFGQSPVHIKTPRGRHLYYRAAGAVPILRASVTIGALTLRQCRIVNCGILPGGLGSAAWKTASIGAVTAPFRCNGLPWMPCAALRMVRTLSPCWCCYRTNTATAPASVSRWTLMPCGRLAF